MKVHRPWSGKYCAQTAVAAASTAFLAEASQLLAFTTAGCAYPYHLLLLGICPAINPDQSNVLRAAIGTAMLVAVGGMVFDDVNRRAALGFRLAAGVLAGGLLANHGERLAYGGVRDWLEIRVSDRFWIVSVGDLGLCLGLVVGIVTFVTIIGVTLGRLLRKHSETRNASSRGRAH